MRGWVIPPPREPRKSADDFRREREEKVRWLESVGLLRSEPIKRALLAVRREEFVPREYRDVCYEEVPIPLPGEHATISCPHSYPLFYEPLGLAPGHRFLEVGLGSGYGAAVAREVVGPEGLVVSIELDAATLAFGRANLDRVGYRDVVVVLGDGALGHPERAPYDRISVTAACREIPPALVEQLAGGGRLIAPVFEEGAQRLTLLEKTRGGVRREALCEVLYLPLRGSHAPAP
jgi:protein-L-isoaspartate(D-aspartate) O-methyltransferase